MKGHPFSAHHGQWAMRSWLVQDCLRHQFPSPQVTSGIDPELAKVLNSWICRNSFTGSTLILNYRVYSMIKYFRKLCEHACFSDCGLGGIEQKMVGSGLGLDDLPWLVALTTKLYLH